MRLSPNLDQIAWRLRQVEQREELQQCWRSTQTHHPAPSIRLCRVQPANDVRNDLSARDEETAHSHESSPRCAWRKFTNVHGHHEARAAHCSAHDASAEYHSPYRGRESLDQRTRHEQDVCDEYDAPPTQRIGEYTRERRSEQREEGCRGRDERLIEGGEGTLGEGRAD